MIDAVYTPESCRPTLERLAPGIALAYCRDSNPAAPWMLYINVPSQNDHADSNGEYRFATLREALSYLTERKHITREEALKAHAKMCLFTGNE